MFLWDKWKKPIIKMVDYGNKPHLYYITTIISKKDAIVHVTCVVNWKRAFLHLGTLHFYMAYDRAYYKEREGCLNEMDTLRLPIWCHHVDCWL